MEMMCTISLHRIFSFHNTDSYDIESINEIDSENTHCCCNLASDNDSTGCENKTKHNRSCITNES